MKRLGVIGYGGRIRGMLATIDKFGTDATVVAVIDPAESSLRLRFPEKLESVTFYDDVEAMLDGADLDGVLIGTNCLYHTPYAIKVLERGLPLFLEKPVAIDEDQLAQLHAASLSTNSEVVVSFPLRLSELCVMTKEVIDSGVIGHRRERPGHQQRTLLRLKLLPRLDAQRGADGRSLAAEGDPRS